MATFSRSPFTTMWPQQPNSGATLICGYEPTNIWSADWRGMLELHKAKERERIKAELHELIKFKEYEVPFETLAVRQLLKEVPLSSCLHQIMKTGEAPRANLPYNVSRPPQASPVPKDALTWYDALHVSPQAQGSAADHIWTDVPEGTELQCERCAFRVDTNLQAISQGDAKFPLLQSNVRLISFVHCPKNGDGTCGPGATPSWRARLSFLQKDTVRVLGKFEKLFRSSSHLAMIRILFGDGMLPGGDMLRLAYLAWRKIWHSKVFYPAGALDERVEEVLKHCPVVNQRLSELRLWGDVINDYQLHCIGHLTKRQLIHMYGIDTPAIQYMINNRDIWREELQCLNDFVGRRRYMSSDQFRLANRAIQRAGTAMARMLECCDMPSSTWDTYKMAKRVAWSRFQEARSTILADTSCLHLRARERTQLDRLH